MFVNKKVLANYKQNKKKNNATLEIIFTLFYYNQYLKRKKEWNT